MPWQYKYCPTGTCYNRLSAPLKVWLPRLPLYPTHMQSRIVQCYILARRFRPDGIPVYNPIRHFIRNTSTLSYLHRSYMDFVHYDSSTLRQLRGDPLSSMKKHLVMVTWTTGRHTPKDQGIVAMPTLLPLKTTPNLHGL